MKNNNSNYLISAIIPTYNGDKILKNSIESIINQSLGWKNIELIIVDDGSTDKNTKKIISDYQKKYPENIKPIFLDKNSGYPGKPRNIGLKNATSDYIIFLDHDDYYLKDGLEKLYHAIIKYNSDMVMCNRYTNINGKKIKNMKVLKNDLINISPLNHQNHLDLLWQINIGYCWANIYKKEFIQKNNIKFPNHTYAEDIYFYMKILKYSKKITVLPKNIVYVHNIHDNSTSTSHSEKFIKHNIKGFNHINNLIQDFNLNINNILNTEIEILLTDFCLADDFIQEKILIDIFHFEKNLIDKFNLKCNIPKKEINILNNAVIHKNFKKALFISRIYKKFHNNNLIYKIYKKIRPT